VAELGSGTALLVVALVITLFVLGIRRFPVEGEWLIVYRLGWTTKQDIRGPWSSLGLRLQAVVGEYVYASTYVLFERVVRVRGGLLGAWLDVEESLPNGVKVRRPASDSRTGEWAVRASGWDEDVASPYPFTVDASANSEEAALHQLAEQVRVAVTRGRGELRP
jgi:hypothetical protein